MDDVREDLTKKSVNELKILLRQANIDYSSCYEKCDLVDRILETGAYVRPEVPQTFDVKIGELDCTVVQNSSQPSLLVVLSHGFGANAQDLLSIAQSAISGFKGKIKFVFPNGPLSLPQGGQAWWPIDLQRLMLLFITGQIRTLTNDAPDQFLDSSTKLRDMINILVKEHNLPYSKVVIGGFSQGAILSTDVVLKLDSNVGALVVWSGTLLNAAEWQRLAPSKKGLKVLQSHGTEDSMLPLQLAEMLTRDIFQTNQMDLDFVKFKGAHTIPQEVLRKFYTLLNQLLKD
eukprot:TRINITY_DN5305_c0_g1_i18.p1 TRINITY_DN5305_c0_g1~~TRINITY_DN5305_c0_g1_i18.p1  ORF type:complete len:312 (-),score=56.94 TRINITY_DN5305_c0_g1_i18:149-1012(-)